MPLDVGTITGQVPHDVEQAILRLVEAVNKLEAQVAQLKAASKQ